MLNFDFSKKTLELFSPSHFVYKSVSYVTFYKLTKFRLLIAFTYRVIRQYVYYNCLLTRL